MNGFMKIKTKDRNVAIDVLKAVAIFLVVVGHVADSFCSESSNNLIFLIFKICYSFHMPLFIFIGGG